MSLRPPLKSKPGAPGAPAIHPVAAPIRPTPRPAVRTIIANWFTEPESLLEPKPARERVRHIRFVLGDDGGFVISFRSEHGDVEHVFEVADLDTLSDGIGMKRALRENTDLRLDAPPIFWRHTAVPWLLNDAARSGEGYFELRPVPERSVA